MTEKKKKPARPLPEVPAGYRKVESGNILAVGFLALPNPTADPLTTILPLNHRGELRILFKNGSEWAYRGVTRETARDLTMAESVGKYFNAEIKGRQEYEAFKVKTHQPAEPAEATEG